MSLQVFSNVSCPVDISRLLTFWNRILEWLSSFTMAIWSPKGKLSCRSALVQMYKSSSWDDMDVELKVILGVVVDDGEGGIRGNVCKVGEKIGFGLDGGNNLSIRCSRERWLALL